MNAVILDNPETQKPEVLLSSSETAAQAPELRTQRPDIASGTAAGPGESAPPDGFGSKMPIDPLPPQPPELDVGALGTVEELSAEDYLALLTNEQIIRDEFRNSIDVGLALIEIRDRRLYRIEFGSFAEYYVKKWRFDKRKVYFLTATAEVHRAITTGTNLPLPEYASQMRPLLGLTPDQVRLAWEHAAQEAGTGPITPRRVRAAVVELQFKAEENAERTKERQARAQRRQQLSQAMADLLERIVRRRPYEELVQTASLLDQQVRFFFPKRPKRVKP
jgi:hypothetical protein